MWLLRAVGQNHHQSAADHLSLNPVHSDRHSDRFYSVGALILDTAVRTRVEDVLTRPAIIAAELQSLRR